MKTSLCSFTELSFNKPNESLPNFYLSFEQYVCQNKLGHPVLEVLLVLAKRQVSCPRGPRNKSSTGRCHCNKTALDSAIRVLLKMPPMLNHKKQFSPGRGGGGMKIPICYFRHYGFFHTNHSFYPMEVNGLLQEI